MKKQPAPANPDPALSRGLRRYLYVPAAITGAAIMIVEILGAKMLSPYVGLSHFVWTAQIAVTLVALCSLKGSPGVTTAALGLAAGWPSAEQPVVVECDPAGGDLLGRYRLERTLGEGASAIVYEAFDPKCERHVALKVLRAERTDLKSFTDRFAADCRRFSAARLDR